MKFIEQQTESPVALDLNKKELPLPEPGVNEHRRYFNHREEEREEPSTDEATVLGGSAAEPQSNEAAEPRLVKIPVADYVAAAHPAIPTDEEWAECLTSAGYDSEQIAIILSGGSM